jgi:hypothetical protein
MNLVEKNIIGFIDSLIVDNYSEAHKFLESIVNEKIKSLIKEAKKENPFAEKNKKSKKAKGTASKKAKSPASNKVKSNMEDPSDKFKKMQSKFDKKDKNKEAFFNKIKKKK